MRYRYAVIEWYDLVDSKRFSIYGFDAMLEDLGIKGGSFLFSHFRIPGKSLDEGLHMMEVVFGKGKGKGKGVVIEEIVQDDEVNKASKTGNRGQSLLLDENDVQTGNMDSTNLSQDPIDMTKEVKAEQEMQELVDYNFYPLMYDNDYDHPYDEDDEAEENTELFAELDDLLERLPFLNDELKENAVGVDAPVAVVKEQLERIEHVVDERTITFWPERSNAIIKLESEWSHLGKPIATAATNGVTTSFLL
ncbi:hypothetical protein Tco_0313972 [Tanacetum coccineum]